MAKIFLLVKLQIILKQVWLDITLQVENLLDHFPEGMELQMNPEFGKVAGQWGLRAAQEGRCGRVQLW